MNENATTIMRSRKGISICFARVLGKNRHKHKYPNCCVYESKSILNIGDTRGIKSKHKRLSLPRQYNPAALQPATAYVRQAIKEPAKQPVNNEDIIDELLDSIYIPDEIPEFPLFEVRFFGRAATL